MSAPTLELWQTEWCPASHGVRQRLTELGLTYLVRQVPVEREDRTELVHATRQQSIPVLVAGGKAVAGEDAIVTYLNTHFAEPPEAEHQRAKAAKAKERNWRKHACNWHQLHPAHQHVAVVRRSRRTGTRRTRRGRLRRPERDRRASHAQERARRRARPVPDPRRLQPAAGARRARDRTPNSGRCSRATSSSTSRTARRTFRRSTQTGCCRSSATSTSPPPPPRCDGACWP